MRKVKNFMATHGRKGSVIVFIAVEDNVDLVLALKEEVRKEAN